MIWHIIKRELFDHINSLRFILTVLILSALMVTNAVVHLQTHPESVRITYLLSFIPLLFTFDALSGEREQGTLRLCLANPISRPVLLIGKFLGTLITVLIPFVFAVLLNLAIISTDSWTQLSAADWGRLGMILLIATSYAGIFIGLRLMVSAGTREPRVSLVILLLIWITAVVFMPSTLGTLSTKWMPSVQTSEQFHAAREAALKQIDTEL